jgi:hypothetical protein
VVLQLFKRYGKGGLLESNDWPDYVETIRPIYEAEELEAIFRVASENEATLIKFLLGSRFITELEKLGTLFDYLPESQLYSRRSIIRDLITKLRESSRNPFPNWTD